MSLEKALLERTINCGRCKNDFIQKWVGAKKRWSQINEVSYWTDGKKWNDWKFLCRSCLKAWYEKEHEIFVELVSNKTRQRTYFSYRGHGSFDKNDHI